MRDERMEMLRDGRIWDAMQAAEKESIQRLYQSKHAAGLHAIRQVATYLGLLAVLLAFMQGLAQVVAASAFVVAFNVFMFWYIRFSARRFARADVLIARGTCVEKKHTEDRKGGGRTTHHYWATFAMKEGKTFTLDLNIPYFGKLSVGETFVFTKFHEGKGGFDYFSEREVKQRAAAEPRRVEEIPQDWLQAEGWKEAVGEQRRTMLAASRAPVAMGKGDLFPIVVLLAVPVVYALVAWPMTDREVLVPFLFLLFSFGLLGVGFLWSTLRSVANNLRASCSKVYYCAGRCTKQTVEERIERSTDIELDNGLRFVLPESWHNRAEVGKVWCINTCLSHAYKSRFIGRGEKFDPLRYEQRLLFVPWKELSEYTKRKS